MDKDKTSVSPDPVSLAGCGVRLDLIWTSHAPGLAAAAFDGELWSLEVTTIPNAATADRYIADAVSGYAEGTVLPFVIRIADGTVIGSTRFWKIDRANRNAEIGYTWIAKSWQGTFVNPAIKYLMLRHAFESINCVRVQFMTDERNAHSRAAILRLGAKEEGILRQERIMPNGWKRNTVVFSILDSEWPGVRVALEARLRGMNIEPYFSAET